MGYERHTKNSMSIALVLVLLSRGDIVGLAAVVPTLGRALGCLGVEAKVLAVTMR